MAKPAFNFDFDAAWSEAVGQIPELGTPLAAIYCDWQTRVRWAAGDPLSVLVRPALPTPARWVNGEAYL